MKSLIQDLRYAEPERVRSYRVSPALFPLLGVNPLPGRTFDPEDEEPGRTSAVVLSWQLWPRRFGGDSAIGALVSLRNEG